MESIKSAINNVEKVLSDREIFFEYSKYLLSSLFNKECTKAVKDGVKISGFNNFSEYYNIENQVSESEHIFLNNYELGDGVVLDVGANMGLISLILSNKYPEKEIYAFEPNPSTFRNLQNNKENNRAKNIQLNKIAVGGEEGSIPFDPNPTCRGLAGQVADQDGTTIEVPSVSLDTFASRQSLSRIALLKIDVEGYEKAVLEGAASLLEQKRIQAVYFEVCPKWARQAGVDPKGAASTLERFGYELNRLDAHGNLTPACITEVSDVSSENWIALRS